MNNVSGNKGSNNMNKEDMYFKGVEIVCNFAMSNDIDFPEFEVYIDSNVIVKGTCAFYSPQKNGLRN